MKKRISLLLVFTLCLSLLIMPVTAQAATKASIKLNKSTLSIALNKKVSLKATVTGTSQTVTWSSSNTKVAKVSKKGVITPQRVGRAVITATANGKKAKCVVTVYSASLSLNDFRSTSEISNINMGSPYIDNYTYLKAGPEYAYYAYYQHQAAQYKVAKAKVIRTRRGITLGMTKKDVIAAYGAGESETFSKANDKLYQVLTQSYEADIYNGSTTLKNAKTVLVYTYGQDTDYAIRFYFNKSNKLISIVYTKDYANWSNFSNWYNY